MREILSGYLLWTVAGGVFLGLTAWTAAGIAVYCWVCRRWG